MNDAAASNLSLKKLIEIQFYEKHMGYYPMAMWELFLALKNVQFRLVLIQMMLMKLLFPELE